MASKLGYNNGICSAYSFGNRSPLAQSDYFFGFVGAGSYYPGPTVIDAYVDISSSICVGSMIFTVGAFLFTKS